MIMKPISSETVSALRSSYLKDTKARVVRNALTRNDVSQISRVFEAEVRNPNLFSIDIRTMKAANQKQSGRCWIFSAMNVLREIIGRKYNISDFELSQNFIAFHDKLEKANYMMEASINEIDQPLNSPIMRFLLATGVHDGGQWDMLVSIVKKYGICPKTAMPETYQSSNTRSMNALLDQRLKKFNADIRKAKKEGRADEIPAIKEQALKEYYNLLVSCLGLPPEKFTFEYADQDGKYHAVCDVSPKEFYEKYLAVDLDDYVGIINGPTEDKPFHKMYTVKYLGNVVGGNRTLFMNLPVDEFKEAILRQLKQSEPVWFGCDCGKDGDRETGLWDDTQFDYENTFDMSLSMTKAEMLDTGYSAMNHAMVFTGVSLAGEKPLRWKIENSWGEDRANKGYYICSDTWFEKYVYEAVVNKKYLTEEQREILDTEPKELEPWDPFGSLAD